MPSDYPLHSRRIHMVTLVLLVALSACTAGWNHFVRYSNAPMPADQLLEEAVYEVALQNLVSARRTPAIIVNDTTHKGPGPAAFVTMGSEQVPGYWVDTLKREVTMALEDPGLRHRADPALVTAAATQLGLTLLEPTSADSVFDPAKRFTPRLVLSRPGFNHDSTLAAIRVSVVCGMLCGNGATVFLARRPGFRWRIWLWETHWVS